MCSCVLIGVLICSCVLACAHVSFHVSVYVFLNASLHVLLCPYRCPYICLYMCPCMCWYMRLFMCPFMRPYICVLLCVSLYMCPYVCVGNECAQVMQNGLALQHVHTSLITEHQIVLEAVSQNYKVHHYLCTIKYCARQMFCLSKRLWFCFLVRLSQSRMLKETAANAQRNCLECS